MDNNQKKQTQVKREPFFRLVRRDSLSREKVVLIYAIAVLGSLLLSSLICAAFSGENPLQFFSALFSGAFGSERRIWLLLQDTALLLGVAVALVPAFKMKFWNLGGNGQILIGMLVSIACMHYLGGKLPDAVIRMMMTASGSLPPR